MAKPPFEPSKIGVFRRRYDDFSEENSEDQAKEIAQVLQWMKAKTPQKKEEEKSTKNRIRALMEAGIELEQVEKVGALAALKNAKQKSFVMSKLWDVVKDTYYAGKDLLSSNRVKTSLTILAGIGIGVAVGAVLGTFVFPGIGTAIGGAAGAALTAGVAAIGGTVGLSILGGFIGSWFGKRVANKAFKHEKRFEISKRDTNKIKKQIGISNTDVQMINGYLYNRAKAVKSPACKQYYKSLRRLAISEASPTGMEKVARFFCSELSLLEKEIAQNDSPALQEELSAVVYILKKLKAANGLSDASKEAIQKAFDDYKQKQEALPVAKLKQGLEYDTQDEISAEVLAKSTGRFLDALPSDVQTVQTELKQSPKSKAISYKHKLQTSQGERLPTLEVKSVKDKRDHLLTMMTVKANQITEKNHQQVTKVIVAQAKAHHENTGHKEVIVLAAGNDDLAVELMVAVKKAGLSPKLSDDEYPATSKDAQRRKDQILARVQELTASRKVSSLRMSSDK
ncbi:MAG: hypothetical protein AB7V32_08475 [Candidatus Berkiella sp.]